MTRYTQLLSVLALFASLALVSSMRLSSPSHAGPALLLEEPILEVHDASLTSFLSTGSSNVQDIRPLVEQRGVNLEGSVRAPAAFPWGMAGNPFEREWSGESSPVMNLATGTARITEVDLSLAAPGFNWTVARSFNAHQQASGGSHRDSNSYQGKNWFQMSQPEIVLYEGGGSYDDVIYLIYGADRFIEFAQVDQSSTTFKATNGAAGMMVFATGATNEPDTYTYTDQLGNQTVFFGFDQYADPAEGQIWTITDNDGNVAFVGDAATGSTAIANGYDASGRIWKAYDTADRRYTYTYTTLNGTDRLTKVEAETKTGGTWTSPTGLATVGKVEYTYYGDETYGDIGGLKTVKLTTPQTDSGINVVKTKYYRYWEGTYDAGTNPGHPHALKLVVDFEGVRQYDWQDSLFDDDFLTASHATLEPYSSAYFEYDSNHRVIEAYFNGECGCGGGTNGTHNYEYESNGSYSDGTGYDTTWATRTVIERPDGSYVTQYFDEVAQPLTRVVTNIDPDSTNPAPSKWVSHVVRTSAGLVQDLHTPANVTGYTHSTGAVTTSTTAGLVRSYVRETSSTASTKGYKLDRKWKEGTSGSAYFEKTWTYETASLGAGDSTVYQAAVASVRDYTQAITSGTTGSVLTSIDTTWRTSSLSREKVDVTLPAVDTSKNGSGSSNTRHQYFNADGTLAFTKDEDGIIAYREYTNGKLSKQIEDADTTQTGSGEDFNGISIPTGFSSSGSPVHRKTVHTSDAQRRIAQTTLPNAREMKTYYTKLADNRQVVLEYSDYEVTPKFHGPVQYSVLNHAGKADVQGTIALAGNESTTALTGHIDETDDDPITAVDFGTVVRLTTNHYNETGGTLEETRLYFDVPSAEPGTDGTHYDPTLYGYDLMGRQWRTKEPHGTIYRTTFDIHGRATASWIGTNDSSFTGGEPSGTDDMVKTDATEYDSGNDGGNGHVTKLTAYVEDGTTDQRVTTFTNDVRGNVLLATNPEAPHAFFKYDNMDRRVATGMFSSTASIVVGTDDPTTETANRVDLSQSFFDEMGRAWKTQRHKITQSTGADADNLQHLKWFDEAGRVIKTDGPDLTKIAYDRLGRQTHRFVLASQNDTTYAHADDVSGDIVMEEFRTTYESSDEDDVIMQAVISRFHDDYDTGETEGALDTNADGDELAYTAANVKGRIQITGMWYDRYGRVTDRVAYGTYGGATFDRDGIGAPARADDKLRTSYTYNTAGAQEEVTDPKGLVARTEYDDAGRVVKVIRNYDSNVNSGNPSGTDDNQTVLYAYTDGLQTSITADLPSGSTDQVTTYTYGTTKGATAGDSEIGTGHLLQKVTYPDSANSDDVVRFAYNAQSELIWKKDQAGNVIETDFDDSGREEHQRITTLDGDFDGAVRRISMTYSSRGFRELVTQYDNATVGSGSVVDEVKFSYEDWGQLSTFEQDRNSAVGASGSVDDYEVGYAYAKATEGRNTVRRTSMTLPSGDTMTYMYVTANGVHDGEMSRVSALRLSGVTLTRYDYLGAGHVVGTSYDQPDVMWEQFGSTSGTYPDLDRFNRVTSSRWTKDLATDVDFYDVDLTYDRNSNIVLAEDNVHAGFDVEYTMDGLDRLTQAEEGTWSGSAITSRTRDQIWTLDQVGNWNVGKLDLDGDGNFTGTDEYNDDRTHNDVNELTARDTDDNGTNDYTLTYDEVGNLIDDGENYKYEYDPFGRLRKVKDQSDNLVAEYKFNGLGFRISVHEDTDDDSDVDASDKWFHFAYDERWRMTATFREDDSDPKEQFVNHNAGADGFGGGSYIDLVAVRDKDANTAWTSASDGVLEERMYYCQNWRADVSAIVSSSGRMQEWVKYSAYGVPFGLPGGDTDSDGDCDSTDISQVQSWIDASSYDVRADVDLDGDVDADDKSILQAAYQGTTLGLFALSGEENRKGLAGQELLSMEAVYQVRSRILGSGAGRFIQRDPVSYHDGLNLYEYVRSSPVALLDPFGTTSTTPTLGDPPSNFPEDEVKKKAWCWKNKVKPYVDKCFVKNCNESKIPGVRDRTNTPWLKCKKDCKLRGDVVQKVCEKKLGI